MYYVYELIDPRNNQPFYVGKGTGRRAKTHLWEIPETRNEHKENKIAAIRQVGLEPKIKYVVENIADETLAYDIETLIIKQYGRKGYDKDGILTNICEDARPPNHKGKTYEEIYGVDQAKEQREKRAQLQKARGGYGPTKHNDDTKKKISATVTEFHANRDCSHRDETKTKIGEANKKYTGRLNKKSKGWVVTSPSNETYTLYGNELSVFCKEHNLSIGTFRKNISEGWLPSTKGKNAGWKITRK